MSSKFLVGGGNTADVIALLNNGTQTLNVADITNQALIPNLPVVAGANKKLTSRQLGVNDLNFTPLTNPATMNLDLDMHSLIDVVNINSIPVSSFLQTPSVVDIDLGTHAISNVTTLNGTLVSNFVTTNNLTDYLKRDGTNAMTATLNVGSNEIKNVTAIRTLNQKVLIGTSATSGSTDSVTIGESASTNGQWTTSIGKSAVASAESAGSFGANNNATGPGSLAVGNGNTAGGQLSVMVGLSNATSSLGAIAIGNSNVPSAARAACIGNDLSNSVSNSLLIGNTNYVNIRPGSTICDLGMSTVPFQSLYAGNIIGSSKTSAINDVVTNAGTSTNGNIASLSGPTGKIIIDSTVSAAQVTTNATNIGTLQTKTQNQTATSNNTNFAGSFKIGNTQTIVGSGLVSIMGAVSSGNGPHISAYVGDQYPVFELFNYAHDNIQLQFDCYSDVAATLRSSSNTGSFRIAKVGSRLIFDYAPSGTAAGVAISPATAGFIDISGNLNWSKNVGIGTSTFSGSNILSMADRLVVPTINNPGGGYLYSEGGALKWRGSAGTVTTIANA